MKRILLFVMLSLALVKVSSAQCVTVLEGPNGQLFGYVEDGEVFYDESSHKILIFSTDGEVQRFDSLVLATYNRVSGQVIDANNELLLTVESDGDVLDSTGGLIGNVDSSGVLRDADDYVLLTVKGSDPFYIAYYYFVYRMI